MRDGTRGKEGGKEVNTIKMEKRLGRREDGRGKTERRLRED